MATVWTIALVLLLVLSVTALRLRWPRLSTRARRVVLFALLLCAFFPVLNLLTSWETTSYPVNALLVWMRAVLYATVVLFFTLLRPRALTVPIAIVLVLPLFSSSALGRLAGIFPPGRIDVHRFGGHFLLETISWGGDAGRNSGVDFDVAYQPPWLHGLRRGLRGGRLYSSQCRTAELRASLDPVRHLILLHCPAMADGNEVVSGTDVTVPQP